MRRCDGRTRRAANWLKGAIDEPRPALWPLRSSDRPATLAADYHLDVDPQTHSITYHEPGRRVAMEWSPGSDHGLYFDTIEYWIDGQGTRTPVSEEEQVEIARRAIRHVRQALGIELVLK